MFQSVIPWPNMKQMDSLNQFLVSSAASGILPQRLVAIAVATGLD